MNIKDNLDKTRLLCQLADIARRRIRRSKEENAPFRQVQLESRITLYESQMHAVEFTLGMLKGDLANAETIGDHQRTTYAIDAVTRLHNALKFKLEGAIHDLYHHKQQFPNLR